MGLTRTENRGCKKKDKDHIEFLCELYEAQAAQERYFVHELTSEASSRMKCIVKIMAMPRTRAAVADLCMFGLAACDDGGPGFVNASVRTITNARQAGVRLQSKCNSTHRHARVDAEDVIGKREQTGTWVCEAARAIDEQLKRDKQELEMREQRKRAEDANRICSIIKENAENKGLSLVEAEMEKLMHQDEQELLSVWEGWHWDDNKGGWLDLELCAKARREEVEYIRRLKMYVRVPREVCFRETGKAPISRQGGRRPTKCEGDGDVVGVVTPLRGVAQVVLHGVQVVEVGELLRVHQEGEVEEDGEGQVEVEREEGEVKENHTCMKMG